MCFGVPFKGAILVGKCNERVRNLRKVENEALVEVGKTKEGLGLTQVLGRWPFFNDAGLAGSM